MKTQQWITTIILLIVMMILHAQSISTASDLESKINTITLQLLIEKQNNLKNQDYQIKLNSDNSLYLQSKDTLRKIDFYDLEEVILQDNL